MSEHQRSDEVSVALPPDLAAPAAARAAVREALRRWRLGQVLDDVLLTVSELVTNAVRHGRPPVWLVLRRGPERLHLDVHDDEPVGLPDGARPAAQDAESGRGLHIVEAVAETVAVEDVPDDGKIVRVTFVTPPDDAAR